ncbi:MAG TPA: HEAT repeat domain-containing protein, partial [Gemmatimonadaceae bacterium]
KYPKSAKAGDALYWRAWSLHKLGVDRRSKSDLDEALVAIEKQLKDYDTSSLATDGRVLRSQIRAAQASLGDADAAGDIAKESKNVSQARGCSGSKVDQETSLAALDGLMSMNSQDAIPILKEVLKQRDACHVEMRKRAVFMISTKRGGEDVALTLLDVARNDPNQDVRGDAVQWLSQTRSDLAVPLLDSVLFTGRDDEVRKRAVFALSQLAQRNDRARQSLRRAAEDEKMSEDIRSDVIFQLGQQRLVDLEYFKTLFKKTTNRELRDKITFAVGQSSTPEGTAWLLDLARDKTVDTETRKNAIFQVSQRKAIDLEGLSALYGQSKGDSEIQEQILFAFSQRREPAALDKLMAVAKSDSDIEMRKKALFWIGQNNDPRAKAFIRSLIIP